MTALLKPWLWPGIEKEVRQILSWKAGGPSASQPVEDAPLYEDDDSNLRIRSSQVPKLVQIIKVRTKHPVQKHYLTVASFLRSTTPSKP